VNLPSLAKNDDLRRSQLKSNLNRPATNQIRKQCTFAVEDISEIPSTSTNNKTNERYQENKAASTFKRTKSFHDKYDFDRSVLKSSSSTSTSSSSSSTYSSFTNDVIRRKYSHGSSLIPDDTRNIRQIGIFYLITSNNYYIRQHFYN
jgi:hypothetical protein